MTNKLQILIQHAKLTFFKKPPTDRSGFDIVKYDALVSLANELTLGDVNLPARLCSRNGSVPGSVEYLSIHEDDNFVVGVFVMEQDSKIPIHDHPGMHGILKVLLGELEVTTYNVINSESAITRPSSQYFYNRPVNVVKNGGIRVRPTDRCSILTPNVNNIHEVKCSSGPAAFLDILSPPYRSVESAAAPRSCHYFKESWDDATQQIKLEQISLKEAWHKTY